jgi:phosphohistidine swiveling domain-containing protein
MKNFLGHDIQWFWAMKKIAPPLGMSAFPVGLRLAPKDWEYETPFLSYWYFYEHSYADVEEVAAIKHYVAGLIEKDPTYPDRMAANIYSFATQIRDQKIIIDESRSLEELIRFFQKESVLFFRMVGMLSYRGPIPIADILNEKVLDAVRAKLTQQGKAGDYDTWEEIVQTPDKQTILSEEAQFIVENRPHIGSHKAEIIKEYRSRYSFLQYHWFVGRELTDEEILSRFAQVQDEKTERTDIDLHSLFTNEEIECVRQLREWIYLRTFIKDAVNLASYKLQPLLGLIASKKGIPAEWMPYFTFEEILALDTIPTEVLQQRYADRKDGYSAQVQGDTLVIGDFGDPPAIVEETEILQGSIAYRGHVVGKVKILNSPKEDFGEADILVVGMTTPDYLYAMKKAKAFITDEGGITCHAAIVAREMQKPCIIGTKTATKRLKDGDMVEVDASNGSVGTIKILHKV